MLKKYQKTEEKLTRILLTIECALFICFIMFLLIKPENAHVNGIITILAIAIIFISHTGICKILEEINKKEIKKFEKMIPLQKEIKILINPENMNKDFEKLSAVEKEILDSNNHNCYLIRKKFGETGNMLLIKSKEDTYCICISNLHGWINYMYKGYFTII